LAAFDRHIARKRLRSLDISVAKRGMHAIGRGGSGYRVYVGRIRQTTATSFWNRRAAGSAEMIDFFFLVPIGLGLAGRPPADKKMCPARAQRPFCSSAVLDRLPLKVIETATCGRVAEWFKAPVLKTGVPARAPWVRIPPLPPVDPPPTSTHVHTCHGSLRDIGAFLPWALTDVRQSMPVSMKWSWDGSWD